MSSYHVVSTSCHVMHDLMWHDVIPYDMICCFCLFVFFRGETSEKQVHQYYIHSTFYTQCIVYLIQSIFFYDMYT